MLVSDMLKLAPTEEQANALLATMQACNEASNHVAEIAFKLHSANRTQVHHETYYDIRKLFGLSSQMAVRAIAKACNAYKRDKTIQPKFRPLGAIAYDQRILSWKGADRITILTLNGRITVPVLYRGRWSGVRRGQTDLVYRDSKFYLVVFIEVPEPPTTNPAAWLGVDLGVVNIATDSDGAVHSGKALRALRRRHRALRAKLQAKGTKSAKRLLKKRRRKESRFARDVNHCISKAIVGKAKDTGRGIALEDLKGIRDGITVGKAQRADLHSWSFYQLRSFIAYKAVITGVVVRPVDSRNTSRTCAKCNFVNKRNRPTRDEFRCISCGFAAPADHNAAVNIARRAAVVQPNVGHPQPPVESVTTNSAH